MAPPAYQFRPFGAADLPLIRQWFVDRLLAGDIPRVITDPDPGNARAIRCCEKAGFARDRIVDTVDGPALLMVRNP